MKTFRIITVLLIYSNLYSQGVIDSSAVKFKAALLTVSEYGIASKEQILKDIESQKITFLKTKYKSFVFLEVDFSQPYRTSDNSRLTLNRNCRYYIAFNIVKKKFYKLGGFDDIDIDDFIKDLELIESINISDWEDKNLVERINVACLYNYFYLNKRQRLKQGYKCFENCSNKTKTFYIEN